MKQWISLELRRTRLAPWLRSAVLLAGVALCFWYLMAFLPRMDPTDPDGALFSSYPFLIGINDTVCTAMFGILGAALGARVVVAEYRGSQALLLFSYPVPRRQILCAKLLLTAGYTAAAMFVSGLAVQGVFFGTAAFFPICAAPPTAGDLGLALLALACCSLLAGLTAVPAVWVGLRRRSGAAAVVASVVLVCLLCQLLPLTYERPALLAGCLFFFAVPAALAAADLIHTIESMEV